MKTIFLYLFLLPIAVTAQIGAKTQQGKIFGVWQNAQFGYQMTLMLNADGSGEFDGEMIKFTYQGGKLSIVQGGQATVYSYSLQDNSLSLSEGDLDQAITFTRSGAQEQTTVAVNDPNLKSQSNSVTDTGLIGLWSGNGETIEFKPDGQCVYLGNTFSYQLSQGHVILATAQGNAMFAYSIKGNQLNLTANGRQVTYSRGATNGGAGATLDNSKAGNVSQELVGKWCWTNVSSTNTGGSSSSECIVLNANGTYEYASERSMDTNTNVFYAGTSSQGSDQGTWWVQGDKIFYNSQTKGQGSYQLQKQNHPKTGDPMILLNGEPYVTFYQKQPWR